MKIRKVKKEIRAIGVDDGPFIPHTKGNAKASVSVTGKEGEVGPGPAIGFGNIKWILYALGGLFVLFILIRRKR